MTKKTSRKHGAFALGGCSVFCGVRFGAPYWQFSVSNSVTYGIYLVYILLTGCSFGAIREKQR